MNIKLDDYATVGFTGGNPASPPLTTDKRITPEFSGKVPYIQVGLVNVDNWSATVTPSDKLLKLFTGFQDVSIADLPALLELVPDFLQRAGLNDIPIPMTGRSLGDLIGIAATIGSFRAPDFTQLFGDPATSSPGSGFSTPAFTDAIWDASIRAETASFGLTGFDITPFFNATLQTARLTLPDATFGGFASAFGNFERLVWEFDKLRADWSGRLPNADGTQGFADFDATFLSKLRGWASAGRLLIADLPAVDAVGWRGIAEYGRFLDGFNAIVNGVFGLPGGYEDIGGLLKAGFPDVKSVSFTPVPGTSLFDLSFDLAGVRRTLDFAAANLGGGIPLDVTGDGSVSFVLGGTVTARVGWDPVTHAPTLDAAHSSVAITAGIDDGGGVSLVSASACDAYTLFLSAYDAAQALQYPDQLLAAVRETTFAFSRKLRVTEGEVVRYFREVQAEALEHRDELQDSMAESAVLIWTSAKRLTLQPGTTIEFCSLLNRILREHDPDLLPSACVVVRGINLLCVMRRDETKLLYPPAGESHRGGGLPLHHLPFFVVGKKFRVPMFLATSFDEDVAYK